MSSTAQRIAFSLIRTGCGDPAELGGFEEWAEWLEAILHNPCSVWDRDGELVLLEIRQLVARVNGIRIEIYANEHAPPHFHVRSPNVDASFAIVDCRKLAGDVSPGDLRKIRYWHKHAKPLLIERWNSTRPTDCVVGKYQRPNRWSGRAFCHAAHLEHCAAP